LLPIFPELLDDTGVAGSKAATLMLNADLTEEHCSTRMSQYWLGCADLEEVRNSNASRGPIRRCDLFCRRADEGVDFIAFDGDQVVGRKLQFGYRAETGGWRWSSTVTWPHQPPAERMDVRAPVVRLADACLLLTTVYLGRVSMMTVCPVKGSKGVMKTQPPDGSEGKATELEPGSM
jgi:hypothetical protein